MAAISDPLEMLRAVVNHEGFFGYDPYYGEIRKAVLDRAQAIVDLNKKPKPKR